MTNSVDPDQKLLNAVFDLSTQFASACLSKYLG